MISSPFVLFFIGLAVVVGLVIRLRVHPFIALLVGGLTVAWLTPKSNLREFADLQVAQNRMSVAEGDSLVSRSAPARIAAGFGRTCGKIGIVIALASIIAVALVRSGAAHSIVHGFLAIAGEKRAPLAFLASGFVLAIPVFFDTMFLLLVPLAVSMYRRTGRDYLLYVLAIVAGGTMAHSLIPPTPGPLMVVSELNVSIPAMLLGGTLVGGIAAGFGYLFARTVNKRNPLTPPPDHLEAPEPRPDLIPPLGWALLPVLLPLLLLTLGNLGKVFELSQTVASVCELMRDKNIAIGTGTFAALLLLARACPGKTQDAVGEALGQGAVILLITAAGGAFGSALRETGIAQSVSDFGSARQTWVLPIVFLVTTLVRTAQGSATVAMITAAPLAAGFAAQVDFHPVYLALALGCGSKPIPWMNDSGFWIITRMSGIREIDTLKFVTPMMSLMGVVGLIVTMLAAWILPLPPH